MASTLGVENPLRYRGYVYDAETGWYYLKTRYYNPVWGRFVNADGIIVRNQFGYCGNNPPMFIDSNGNVRAPAMIDDGSGRMQPIPENTVPSIVKKASGRLAPPTLPPPTHPSTPAPQFAPPSTPPPSFGPRESKPLPTPTLAPYKFPTLIVSPEWEFQGANERARTETNETGEMLSDMTTAFLDIAGDIGKAAEVFIPGAKEFFEVGFTLLDDFVLSKEMPPHEFRVYSKTSFYADERKRAVTVVQKYTSCDFNNCTEHNKYMRNVLWP